MNDQIHVVGSQCKGGTYALHIKLAAPVAIAFGRFKKGKVIDVPAGDYLYVSSALADRGATTLARRLVRHATRTDPNRSHSIRSTMLETFPSLGLCSLEEELVPQNGKKIHWNIDHLLDRQEAELTSVLLIRSPLRIEAEVGQMIEADPATSIVERGLGANDIQGNTHLLRFNADKHWWKSLPKRVQRLLKRKPITHRVNAKRKQLVKVHADVVEQVEQIPFGQIENFFGRHEERQRAILRLMESGSSYSSAYRVSSNVFDTKRWRKIPNRLSAVRGCFLTELARLCQCGVLERFSQKERSERMFFVQQAQIEVDRLASALATQTWVSSDQLPHRSKEAILELDEATERTWSNLSTGLAKLRKTGRDLPSMAEKLGSLPTINEIAVSVVELARLEAGLKLLASVLSNKSFINPKPSLRTKEDLWGVGVRYAVHLRGIKPLSAAHPVEACKDEPAELFEAMQQASEHDLMCARATAIYLKSLRTNCDAVELCERKEV